MTEEAVSGGQAVVHGVPLAATLSPVQFNCSPVAANGNSSPEKVYSDSPAPVTRTVPNLVCSVVITVAVLVAALAACAAAVCATGAAGAAVAAEAAIATANGAVHRGARIVSSVRRRIPMNTLFRIFRPSGITTPQWQFRNVRPPSVHHCGHVCSRLPA